MIEKSGGVQVNFSFDLHREGKIKEQRGREMLNRTKNLGG